jgi:APA family basic amino acid/polyamine antiporter
MVRIAAGAGTVFLPSLVLTLYQPLHKLKSTKGMPIGILGSLVICTILYVLFAHNVGLVPYYNL